MQMHALDHTQRPPFFTLDFSATACSCRGWKRLEHCVAVARGPTHLRPSADTLRLLKGERFDCAFRMPLPWLVVRKPIRDKAGHSRPLLQAVAQPERALSTFTRCRPGFLLYTCETYSSIYDHLCLILLLRSKASSSVSPSSRSRLDGHSDDRHPHRIDRSRDRGAADSCGRDGSCHYWHLHRLRAGNAGWILAHLPSGRHGANHHYCSLLPPPPVQPLRVDR